MNSRNFEISAQQQSLQDSSEVFQKLAQDAYPVPSSRSTLPADSPLLTGKNAIADGTFPNGNADFLQSLALSNREANPNNDLSMFKQPDGSLLVETDDRSINYGGKLVHDNSVNLVFFSISDHDVSQSAEMEKRGSWVKHVNEAEQIFALAKQSDDPKLKRTLELTAFEQMMNITNDSFGRESTDPESYSYYNTALDGMRKINLAPETSTEMKARMDALWEQLKHGKADKENPQELGPGLTAAEQAKIAENLISLGVSQERVAQNARRASLGW
ncbi:hypothetical protein BH10CYA1_BH10CYA1_62400 [soil metagenome]